MTDPNYDNINQGEPVATREFEDYRNATYKYHTSYFNVKIGENLVRGQVCAVETSSGLIVAYIGSGSGGEEIAKFIAADDVDATAAEATTAFDDMGVFNKNKLTLADSGDSIDDYSIYASLRQNQIIIEDSMSID